jgi:hypothetical protein
MDYANVGDVVTYCESGDRLKVEVIEARDKPEGKAMGEEYKVKLLEVISSDDQTLHPGLEFIVWRAKEGHPQFGGWYFKN